MRRFTHLLPCVPGAAGSGQPFVIGLVVLAACLLIAAPGLKVVDEYSIYTTAVNLADHGRLDSNQFGLDQGAIPGRTDQGLLGLNGDVYSKKSPLVIFLAALCVKLGRVLAPLGPLRAALLLNPLMTALTAAWLYRFGRQLGYSSGAAAGCALTSSLATGALWQSRTLFGEPVAALGLVVALDAAWRAQDAPLRPRELAQHGAWCGLGLALAIGTTAVYVLAIPLLALALAWPLWRGRRAWPAAAPARIALIVVSGPWPVLAVFGLGLAAYNALRFGSILQTGYQFGAGQESFSTPLWWGALGLVFSPARGLLWYSPPVWLALAGWLQFHRAHAILSRLMIAMVALHLAVFGAWWAWWGGWGWGPRFLAPLIPVVMLAGLPVFAAAAGAARPLRRAARLSIALCVLAGLVVQIAGSAFDYTRYELELEGSSPPPPGLPKLYKNDPALVYDIARSPIVVHAQRLLSGSALDYAWAGQPAAAPALPELIPALAGRWRAGDVVVFVESELLDPLLTANAGLPPVYGLSVDHAPPGNEQAAAIFEGALRRGTRLWLVTRHWRGDPANWYEARLRERWASVSEDELDGYRLLLFARPPADGVRQPSGARFGPLRLTGYRVDRAAGMLSVELAWQADEVPPENYVTFVHVIAADGTLVAGQDREPLGGYRPTGAWSLGETVVDRFAFALAPEQLDGAHVDVGWYAWPSLDRLAVEVDGRPVPGGSLTLP
jgi:hypothetical protein